MRESRTIAPPIGYQVRATLSSSAKAVEEADLVVEAIIESLKVKRDLFGYLDTKARYVLYVTVKV